MSRAQGAGRAHRRPRGKGDGLAQARWPLSQSLREGDETARSGNGFAFRDEAFRGGKIVVRGKSKYQPKTVWGPNRTPCDPGDIEGGDHVVAELTVYWFDQQSIGVGIGLNALWLIRKGEHKIERGGRTGTSFESFDTTGIQFDVPAAAPAEDDENDGDSFFKAS